MGFDAGKAVSILDYNFRPIIEVSGCTPEPSGEMFRNFRYRMKDAAKVLGLEYDPDDQQAMLKFMGSLTKEQTEIIDDESIKALAELTSGKPSFEDLKALQSKSYRHFMAYTGWLLGEITDPEGPSAVSMNHSRAGQTSGGPTLQSVKS